MTPDTPILMIALQIPVTPETRAEDILEALSAQLSAAIEAVQKQREEDEANTEIEEEFDFDAAEAEAFRATVPRETEESYTDNTRVDLLASMGYAK